MLPSITPTARLCETSEHTIVMIRVNLFTIA